MKPQRYIPLLFLLLTGCSKSLLTFSEESPAKTVATKSTPAAPAIAVKSAPGKIQAVIVVGDVLLVDATGNRKPLVKGLVFEEGNTVLTGPNAGATLVFSNGATINMKENSQLTVMNFKQAPFDEAKEGTFLRLTHDPSYSNTELDLRSGAIQGEVKQLNKAAGSTFNVNTPGKSTTVEGVFQLSVPPAGSQHASPDRG